MELAPRVLSLLPILLLPADSYAAMARTAHINEVFLLTHISQNACKWSDLVVKRTTARHDFVIRRIASGLLLTAVCDQIHAALPPGDWAKRHRAWNRRAALLGALGQRRLSTGMRLLLPADQHTLIQALSTLRPWAAAALVGARSANLVEDALKQGLRGAIVRPSSTDEDALEAADFIVTWPQCPGGYLVQVKTAVQRDTQVRVLVFHRTIPHRHQFLFHPGENAWAEEIRGVGDRQYQDAQRVWGRAQERWQQTKDPWFAAFITVQDDLPSPFYHLLTRQLAQSFVPPLLVGLPAA